MANLSLGSPEHPYTNSAGVPEPYPVLQGMSPNVAAATRGLSSREHRSGGALQMPASYGSTATAYDRLANGVSATLGGQGPTQRDEQRPGAADVSGGGSLDTPMLAQLESGSRVTGLDGATSREGVQGRVGVGQPTYTTTFHELHPPLHPAPADQQQPHTPAQRQQAAAQVSTPLAEGGPRDDVPGPLQGHAATAGTRLSVEAQRAMTQLASQRAALVQALQTRARGTLGAVEAHETSFLGVGESSHQEGPCGNGDEVVWYSRLQGFLRRRVMDPVREQMETLRRNTPSASPQTTWFGSPLPNSEPLMSPATRRAMQEWTARQSPLLSGPPPEVQETGLTEEDIQDEVRRQVQSVMVDRDQRMHALQSENAELRSLLTSFLERTNAGEGAQSSGEAQSLDRLPGPGGGESSGTLGVTCGVSGHGRETSQEQSLGAMRARPVAGTHPPGLPAQSQADLRHPPGLLGVPRVDLQHPAGLLAQSRADLRQPVGDAVVRPEGHLDSMQEQFCLVGGQYSGSVPGIAAVGGGERQVTTDAPAGHVSAYSDGGGRTMGVNVPQAPRAVGFDDGWSRAQGDQAESGRQQPTQPSATPLELLAQGIQQLQQLQLRKDTLDPELLKGAIDLPKLPEPYQESSAVSFLEWIYEAGQVVGSITDKASGWWARNVELALGAYYVYQRESSLNKLKVRVQDDPEADDARWSRLEKRVMTLLLQAMPAAIKNEVTMLRIGVVKDCLFKLYTVYAPGGTSERARLIRQLEAIPVNDSVMDAVVALRKWKKLVGRAQEMGVSLPDGSVLLMAVENSVKKIVDGHRDMSFKLSMAKQSLQLPHMPTQTSVMAYTDHVLAELQQIVPLTREGVPRNDTLKLRGVQADGPGPSTSTSPAGSPSRGKSICKYFASDEGCRRGAACKYEHSFVGKEDKRQRCWTCGSKSHRQGQCPTKSPRKAQQGQGSPAPQSSSASTTTVAATTAPSVNATAGSSAPTALPSSAAPSAAATTSNDGAISQASMPTTLESRNDTLASSLSSASSREIGEMAEQFLARLKKLAMMRPLQEATDQAVHDLEILLRGQGFEHLDNMALLDSGASNAFRKAKDEREHTRARRVAVQLADGRTVKLKQTAGGTLIPEKANGEANCTILPLGSLVESLGCSLEWNKKHGLRVYHPVHGLLPTKLVGNCPMLRETEALALIADLEQMELNKLNTNNLIGAASTLIDNNVESWGGGWREQMAEFLTKGEIASLRRVLRDEEGPMFLDSELARMSLTGDLDVDFSDQAGVRILRALPVKRALRRRMLQSRWAIHFFSGVGPHPEISFVESNEVVLLNIDVRVSKAWDLHRDEVFRAMLWAAGRGQIEGVYGGPPRHSDSASFLVRRMLLTWMVAECGSRKEHLREPFFALEMPPIHALWQDQLWLRFQEAYDFSLVEVVHEESSYVLATDLDVGGVPVSTTTLRECRSRLPASVWPEALRRRLGEAMRDWRMHPFKVRMARALCRVVRDPESMTDKEVKYWEAHVKRGHILYDRRCATCIRTAGSGRAHWRVLAPSAYTLSLDISGPYRVTGESVQGSGFRYILAGAYTFPKLDCFKECDLPLEGDIPADDDGDPFEEEAAFESPDGGDDGPVAEGEDAEQKARNDRFRTLFREIGDDLDFQTLHFAVPLRTRTSGEVLKAVRHMYVLLRRDGLVLNRIHSDRAREFTSPPLREWAAARDIFVTTSESLTPQQNGRAESVVRCLKQRARTLLRAASLPRTLWPAAMTFASEYQRRAALGLLADSTPPFGTVVHCRSKVFGVGGHHDLNEKWLEGRFVGWSEDVVNGHVVKLDSGGYITTAHVRPFLVDSDQLVAMEPYEAHVPVPERRVRGKTTLRPMAMVTPASNSMEDLARTLFDQEKFAVKDLCRFWEEASDNAFPKGRQCFHGANPRYMAFGQYTHGMFSGLMSSTYRYPYTVQYLTRCFEEFCPYDKFATLTVSEDVGMACHRDVHNERDSYNVVLPLQDCDGGGLWIESEPDQFSLDDEWRPIPNGEWRRGQVHQLRAGAPIRFSARKWHQTEPWQGRRLVMICYTPRMGALQRETYDDLLDLGCNPPPFPTSDTLTPTLNMISMVPESGPVDAVAFHGQESGVDKDDGGTMDQAVQSLQNLQEDLIDRFQERVQHLRELLAEEEVIAAEFAQVSSMAREEVEEVNTVIQEMLREAQCGLDKAVEAADTKFLMMAGSPENLLEDVGDIEKYLSELTGDLGTTLTVPLEQVKENLPVWIPAISKEIHNVEEATQALRRIPMQQAKTLEREGRLKLVPGKLVFTVKPPAEPSRGVSGAPRWKRKARLVICGNFIDPDSGMNLFATGASAESLRVALCLASKACWSAGCTDITGAFLLAVWPSDKPTYGVLAPRILVRAGLAREDEVFLVCRPLYGFREAPALWAQFRSEKLAALKVPFRDGFLVLRPVVMDSELWRIMFMDGEGELTLRGVLVTYVDDLLYLCLKCVMEVLHQAVKDMWPCSTLEFAAQGEGVRYLGMELYERENGFLLSQAGYIESLLKGHGLHPDTKAQLPCPREWLSDEDDEAEVENFSESELRQGQRIVGECLWLAFRTRPDLVFITNYMASLVSKRPCFVYRVGLKVLSYLNATATLQLKVDGRNSTDDCSSTSITSPSFQGPLRVELRGFSDASFAPFGTRSFGCCLAVVGRTPVAWKASRQPYVTLSQRL